MKKRVAIVGFGFMGRMHYGVWKRIGGAEVVAVCDANLAQLTTKVSGNRPGVDNSPLPPSVASFDDYDALMRAGGFDIVDITLPTFLHAKMTVRALTAGHDVLCEKPMALCTKECDAMVAAMEKSGRTLLFGQCCRFDPQYRFLKRLVDSGKYGKVIAAEFGRFCPAPGWTKGGGNWFQDEGRSGGLALDLHIHDADLVRWLFGAPPAVSARSHERPDGLTDHFSVSYLYPDKVVTAAASWAVADSLVFDKSCRVFFERATVCCGLRFRDSVMVYPQGGEPFVPKLEKGGNYENEIRYFLSLTNGRKPLPEVLTAYEARDAVALVERERRSAKSGRTMKLPTGGSRR